MERERGSATVMGIVLMLLLACMGAALLLLSKTNLEIAASRRDGIAAQYLAEAGVQIAVIKLKTDPGFILQTETKSSIMTRDFDSGAAVKNYTVATGPVPGSMNKDERIIISTGTVNKASRQIIANVLLPMPGRNFTTIWNE